MSQLNELLTKVTFKCLDTCLVIFLLTPLFKANKQSTQVYKIFALPLIRGNYFSFQKTNPLKFSAHPASNSVKWLRHIYHCCSNTLIFNLKIKKNFNFFLLKCLCVRGTRYHKQVELVKNIFRCQFMCNYLFWLSTGGNWYCELLFKMAISIFYNGGGVYFFC